MLIKKTTLSIITSIPIILIITLVIFFPANEGFYFGNLDFYGNSLMANDAYRYYDVIVNYSFGELFSVVHINVNLIPPTLPIYFFDKNLYAVYFFLLLFLYHSIFSISCYVKNSWFMLSLIFSPIVLSNLFPASKEITSLISGIYFLSYLLGRRNFFFLLSIVFAILTRIELVFVLIVIYLTLNISFFKRNKLFIFILILLSFSFLLKLLSRQRGSVHLEEFSNTSMLGLSGLLESLISNGMYFLIFPIKLFQNLFEKLLVPDFTFLGAAFTTLSSFSFFILFLFTLVSRSYKAVNYEVFFSLLIYSIFFSAAAFVQHRYFVFLYPLLLFLGFYKYLVKNNFLKMGLNRDG